jgi:adapter protein MecA 1/2
LIAFWIQATLASEDEFVITVIKQEDQIDTEINQLSPPVSKKKRSRNHSKRQSGAGLGLCIFRI